VVSDEAEIVYHVLWDCLLTRDVWGASDRVFQKSTLQGPIFLNVAEGIIHNYGKEALNTFMVTTRQIWLRRNEVVHGGIFTHPNIIVSKVRAAMEEFQAIN
jgi:hypothetical protein